MRRLCTSWVILIASATRRHHFVSLQIRSCVVGKLVGGVSPFSDRFETAAGFSFIPASSYSWQRSSIFSLWSAYLHCFEVTKAAVQVIVPVLLMLASTSCAIACGEFMTFLTMRSNNSPRVGDRWLSTPLCWAATVSSINLVFSYSTCNWTPLIAWCTRSDQWLEAQQVLVGKRSVSLWRYRHRKLRGICPHDRFPCFSVMSLVLVYDIRAVQLVSYRL